jgi:hypothetical protein
MKIRIAAIIPALTCMMLPLLWCQGQTGGAAGLQQKAAELKQVVAANRAALMKYQWTQETRVSLKGETKKDSTDMCRYGPDGKVVKTPVGSAPAAQQQLPQKGLRGRIVQKKVAEMKDYTERLKSLISHYAPSNPEMIQAAVDAGNVSLNATPGVVNLTLTNYYKPGDKVVFGFDPTAKKLRSYDVNTYLDDPQKDIVTLTNRFASLPDGTNYLAMTVLDAKEKQIQVTTTNSNYSPVGQ